MDRARRCPDAPLPVSTSPRLHVSTSPRNLPDWSPSLVRSPSSTGGHLPPQALCEIGAIQPALRGLFFWACRRSHSSNPIRPGHSGGPARATPRPRIPKFKTVDTDGARLLSSSFFGTSAIPGRMRKKRRESRPSQISLVPWAGGQRTAANLAASSIAKGRTGPINPEKFSRAYLSKFPAKTPTFSIEKNRRARHFGPAAKL
jgi:hypothetical protein